MNKTMLAIMLFHVPFGMNTMEKEAIKIDRMPRVSMPWSINGPINKTISAKSVVFKASTTRGTLIVTKHLSGPDKGKITGAIILISTAIQRDLIHVFPSIQAEQYFNHLALKFDQQQYSKL